MLYNSGSFVDLRTKLILGTHALAMHYILITTILSCLPLVAAHASIWTPAMYGFNVTGDTFPYDNRPVSPLVDMTFDEWWFHNHLDYPPNPGDFFELPAGQPATAEIACNKGATSFFASSDGGDIRDPNNPNDPCPGSPTSEYHTTGIDDVKGCALAIAYKSDAKDVKPEDFAVFSVNQTCVWTRFTDFQVPERMPPCPEGGCTCAFFWIHSPDSGSEQNYMNGFKCNVTSSTSNVPIAAAKVPRRCGADPANNKLQDAPANCTYGAKQPFYWFNKEENNMFEGAFSPPFYTDLYNFLDGAQKDIFEDSYAVLPDPAPNAPLPVLADIPKLGASSQPGVAPSSALPVPSSSYSSTANASPSSSASPIPAPVGNVTTLAAQANANSNVSTLATSETDRNPNLKTCQPNQPSSLAARSLTAPSTQRHAGGILALAKRSRRLGKRDSLWHIF